jgi:hypothetical protein
MTRFRLTRGTPPLLALALLACLGAGTGRAEEKAPGATSPAVAGQPAPAKEGAGAQAGDAATAKSDKGAAACAEMKASMAKRNAELESKLAAVDAASGEAKLSAMSALLHELVSQHTAMMSGGGAGCGDEAAAGAGGAAHEMAMAPCAMMGEHDAAGAHGGGHGDHGKSDDHDAHH